MRPNPKPARNLISAAHGRLAAVGSDPFGVPADVARERLRLRLQYAAAGKRLKQKK